VPERNTIRIFQTHNVAGEPATAEYTRVIYHGSVNTLGSDAMLFLRPLNPRQTEQPGVFYYTDPTHGSGWLRLEHFSTGDATRIQELVRMEEITRVVGKEPLRNADLAIGNAMVVRTNNPWVALTFASVVIVMGIMTFTAIPRADDWAIAIGIMGALLILVGIALVITSSIRLPWWRRARRYVRSKGEKLPPDITGL
jgi:hypothetical protein